MTTLSKHLFRTLISLVAAVVFSSSASAEKMDIPTTTIVIKKLEGVLSSDQTENVKKPEVVLRLADLYAERARLKFMRQIEKKCKSCENVRGDRLTALKYYELAYKNGRRDLKGMILLQMAHLNVLVGRTSAGEALYRRVLKQGRRHHSKVLLARTHVALGDLLFQKRKFSQALDHYSKGLSYHQLPRKGYAHYRSAWCLFNMGRTRAARQRLTLILQSPNLMDLDGSGQIDGSFHEDVSRDLATYLAKGSVGSNEIQVLADNSPRDVQLENLKYLAEELERLGKKNSAILVWNVLLTTKIDKLVSLKSRAHLSKLLLDTNRKKSAALELKRGLAQWRAQSCKKVAECELIRKRYRKTITDWNRFEKRNLSIYLMNSYREYIATFPRDVEMIYWGAIVARERKSFNQGMMMYRQASLEAYSQIKKAKASSRVLKTIFEGALLGEIEMAEGSKNNRLKLAAYDHYLKYNPNGLNRWDVLYQRAQVFYDTKRYKGSAEEFKKLALNSSVKFEMRKKSADLALDSLVLLKDHQTLERWSIELSNKFKARRAEYQKIHRTSVLNQSKSAIRKGSDEQYRAQLAKLKTTPLRSASQAEKIAVYKNRMILGERLKDLNEVHAASSGLLSIRGLSDRDKQFAYGRQLWVAEMTLSFASAYSILKKMDLSQLKRDQRALKLAMYAELSGKPSHKHYREFIEATPSRRRANEIRAKLIKESRYPWAALDKELSKLRSTPALLADLGLWIFAKYPNFTRAKKVLDSWKVKTTASGRVLARAIFEKEFNQFARSIRKHRVRSQSDRLVQKTLAKRIDLLSTADEYLKKATLKRDWILQIKTLTLVAKENERLYAEVLNLPTPAGLNKVQKTQYKQLLASRAATFNRKASASKKKLDEFWSKETAMERLIGNFQAARFPIRNYLKGELSQLAAIAPRWKQYRLRRAVNSNSNVPSRNSILAARNRLKSQPFSVSRAKELRALEAKAGGDLMVAFLDRRQVEVGRR